MFKGRVVGEGSDNNSGIGFGMGLACQAKGLSCHTKNQPLPKY